MTVGCRRFLSGTILTTTLATLVVAALAFLMPGADAAAQAPADARPDLNQATHPAATELNTWSPAGLWDENNPVTICFTEDTPPEVMEEYYRLLYGDAVVPRYFLGARWSGVQGSPRALTWSLVPDGTTITDSTGGVSNLFAQMDSKFAAQGGRAAWINRIQQCFDRWQEIAGVSFTRVTSGGNDWDDGASWPFTSASATRGDIRICGRSLGMGGTLAYAYFPNGGGDILMDTSENFGSTTNQNRFFRNTLMHEAGHSLGIGHICSGNSAQLLEPFLQTGFDGPQHDDVRAGQRHYGDVFENDNTFGAASDIGAVDIGSPILIGPLPPPVSGFNPANTPRLSIDANGEADWFRFNVSDARVATVTITPQGFTYDNTAETGSGCPACCSNIDSLAVADLNVQIYDTNGSTVLGTAAVNPAGSAETLTDVLLPVAGNYYVRVYEGDSPFGSQLYRLDLSVAAPPCQPPDVGAMPDDSTVCGSPWSSATPTAGGDSPFTWSLLGVPPAGMTINPGNGVVSWPNPLPSAAPYVVTVQAASQCGPGTDSTSFNLTVKPGDYDGDGLITLADIGPFVDHLIDVSATTPCATDVDLGGAADALDVQPFIDGM